MIWEGRHRRFWRRLDKSREETINSRRQTEKTASDDGISQYEDIPEPDEEMRKHTTESVVVFRTIKRRVRGKNMLALVAKQR